LVAVVVVFVGVGAVAVIVTVPVRVVAVWLVDVVGVVEVDVGVVADTWVLLGTV
jgi:hypothetical protein